MRSGAVIRSWRGCFVKIPRLFARSIFRVDLFLQTQEHSYGYGQTREKNYKIHWVKPPGRMCFTDFRMEI
jgi:hypothetical protein